MDHTGPARRMDSVALQEPLQNEASSDHDAISDMNIADDTDSNDTMTVESTDGMVLQSVGDSEDVDDSFLTGKIIAEINLSTIDNLLSNRSRIYTTSDCSSDDNSESAMTDVESEDRVTGMMNDHLYNTRPRLVSTTPDHHILHHGSDEQPVTAAVATSTLSTFQNRQTYGGFYFRLTLQE